MGVSLLVQMKLSLIGLYLQEISFLLNLKPLNEKNAPEVQPRLLQQEAQILFINMDATICIFKKYQQFFRIALNRPRWETEPLDVTTIIIRYIIDYVESYATGDLY